MRGHPPVLQIDLASPLPASEQIVRGLRATVVAGRFRSGDQLPSVRQLAVDLGVHHKITQSLPLALLHPDQLEPELRSWSRLLFGVDMPFRPTQGDENHRRHPRVSGGLAEELHADRLIMEHLSF